MRTIERNGESKVKQKLPTLASRDNGIKMDVVSLTQNKSESRLCGMCGMVSTLKILNAIVWTNAKL